MHPRIANRLLGSLTNAPRTGTERSAWHRAIEPVHLSRGRLLAGPDAASDDAWFPTSATVSILYAMANGASGEVALVGDEGVIGWSLLPGLGASRCRAVVSGEGEGFRVRARLVAAELEGAGAPTRAMARFTEALLAQTSLTAACNRHHRLEQQLCRLLLTSLDRSPGQRLNTTHEWLATRLGVRREGVTIAVNGLRDAGAVVCRRGTIEVIDRTALEARSCECYAVAARARERLPY